MDSVIIQARELGKTIQADPRYIAYNKAALANEQDEDLQKLIATFESNRNLLNEEIQKSEKDTDKIKELDAEVKDCYNKIFASPTMTNFNNARNDLQEMLTFINQIITGSSNGQNPETIEPASCASSCSSCSGCS